MQILQPLLSLLTAENIAVVLIAVAAFAAVLSAAAPFTQSDPLKTRMKLVERERELLRSRRIAQAAGEARLRNRQESALARRFVDGLRLTKVFEAEPSRELLRQAGLRSPRHVTFYLAARFLVPVLAGLITFIYVSTIFANAITPPMRIAASVTGLLVGNYLPYLFVRNLVSRRQASIRRAWPDALDLMLICVEAGMATEPAMQRVAREIGAVSVPLAEEMALTVAELSYLQDRRKAFENLGKRTGLPQVRAVVTSLIQSERYGTPLGTALRVLAQENRDMRMADAERKAAALPPRLTVPMMLFFMPSIFVVILGPAAINVMKSF